MHCRRHDIETTTAELLRLRDWLVDGQVTVVGMEPTGVYWKPIYYYLLEEVRQEDRGQRLGVDR